MSEKHQLKPRGVVEQESRTRGNGLPPSTIQVIHTTSCDSSYNSQEDLGPIMNTMNPPTSTSLNDSMDSAAFTREEFTLLGKSDEKDWRQHLEKELSSVHLNDGDDDNSHPCSSNMPVICGEDRGADPAMANEVKDEGVDVPEASQLSQQKTTRPIFRTSSTLTSASSNSQMTLQTKHKKLLEAQQKEIQSILSTLEELQHNFVTNDNSRGSQSSDQNAQSADKEFQVRNFPNGDLFSGNVSSTTKELIYGRMTSTLEMEVYEGPFRNGKRHGDGAVCVKMDGGAKYLGRYHEGQMHSGTLIVTRNLPSDFTYTGTFLNNDFHGVGTIVSQDGSIYQGQFVRGQYHGLGTLRTVCGNDGEEVGEADVNDDGDSGGGCRRPSVGKVESVYTGEFSEGIFHGFGSLANSDGSSYIGYWVEGRRSGEGTETLPNGDTFQGTFLGDEREGRGVLHLKSSRITKSGIWEGNVLKDGCDLELMFEGGHVYCGDHAYSSLPHGIGRMEYADSGSGKSIYTGWFVNGLRHGDEGRCFFHTTGEEYEGPWACDEPVDLALFQHSGQFTEEGQDNPEHGRTKHDEGQDILKTLECPPTSLNVGLNSSIISAASSGVCSENTRESEAMSSITNPHQGGKSASQQQQKLEGLRQSNTDSDNLAYPEFDYNSEQSFKVYRYENGDLFKGRLDKATKLRQGSGVYTEHKMGSVYNGDWKDSKRHGVGHLKLASGVEYSGEFFEDRIHGQGRMTLLDGSVFTGSFFNGLFHGRGMLENEGQDHVYFGEFNEGERSGDGDEKFSDGSRYKGGYKNGQRNGKGILFDPDGSERYTGEWRDDMRHGKGKLMRRGQEGSEWEGSYEGDFCRDKFSGNGTFTYTDGTSIEGQWLDDKPRDGDWSIKYPDGSKFYGFATFQYTEEKSDGSNGSLGTNDTHEEVLRVPLPHGFGSLTDSSGKRFTGSFVYGKYTDGA